MEMRTGKTLSTILAITRHRKPPILILAPCMALQNWRNAFIEQGYPEDQVVIADGSEKRRTSRLNSNPLVTICNYEMSMKYKLKARRSWKVIVFDETYRIANISNGITKYWIRGEIPEDQMRIGLSGEPAPETPLNFVSQYMIITGEFMKYTSYNDYLLDHYRMNQYTNKYELISKAHLKEVTSYIQSTAHCVTMAELGLGSEFLYNEYLFEQTAAQKKLWKKVENWLETIGKGIGMNDDAMLGMRARMQMISAGIDPEDHSIIDTSKIKFIVDAYKESPEPMVVFSHFKAPAFKAKEMFEEAGISCNIITGETKTTEEKERIKDDFLAGKFDIMIAQTRTTKMNYDFSRASKSWYLNNSYSQDDRSQSEKRITNLNKKEAVEIIDMCTIGTLDQKIAKRLREKKEISEDYIREAIF